MKLAAVGAALLALASVAVEGPAPADPVEAALARHVAVLADDTMEGRKPGTPGGERAADYIAARMAEAGLKPAGVQGSWLQPVDLVERRTRSARIDWEVGGHHVTLPADQFVLLGREERMRLTGGRLIFGGYGLPENLAGVDVEGATVLLLAGKPEGKEATPSFDRRRNALAARGAAAVLTLIEPSAGWRTVRDQYRAGRTTLADDGAPRLIGAVSATLWSDLLRRAGHDPARLVEEAADRGFRALPIGGRVRITVKTALQPYRSANVVGRLVGAGGSGEAVVLTAHWDHLGICRRAGLRDRICNGAVDNASGVASMLEIAHELGRGAAPPRDIYFVATTAEEFGLLGARAFTRHPPVPLQNIVAALNLDTVAIAPRGAPVAIIGRGMTRLDPLIDQVARAQGRKVDSGTAANAYVARQDGWALMEEGVPAVMVGGAFSDTAGLEHFFASRYHGPADNPGEGVELGGAAEDVRLHVALARVLADPARFPASAR